MSLHHYEIDMSQLSSDGKTVLTQRINRFAETDLAWSLLNFVVWHIAFSFLSLYNKRA